MRRCEAGIRGCEATFQGENEVQLEKYESRGELAVRFARRYFADRMLPGIRTRTSSSRSSAGRAGAASANGGRAAGDTGGGGRAVRRTAGDQHHRPSAGERALGTGIFRP